VAFLELQNATQITSASNIKACGALTMKWARFPSK
jgi:hypothetical protein